MSNHERMAAPAASTTELPAISTTEDELEALFNADPATDEDRRENSRRSNADSGGTVAPEFATEAPRDTESQETDETADAELAISTPDVYQRSADALLRGTKRVTSILEALSAGVENRANMRDRARTTVMRIGTRGLEAAKEAGLTTAAMAFIAMETVGDVSADIRDKTVSAARAALIRRDNRAAARAQRRLEREMRNEDHAEAIEMDDAMTVDAQDAAYDSYSDNINATKERENQEAAEARAQEEREAAEALELRREQWRAALARRAARREKWENRINGTVDKGSELYGKAKGKVKRFGRAVRSVYRRTRATVSAATSAAKETWNSAPGV